MTSELEITELKMELLALDDVERKSDKHGAFKCLEKQKKIWIRKKKNSATVVKDRSIHGQKYL